MRASVFFPIALLFVAGPAFANEAVVVPNDNGTTVIRDHGLLHDKTTVIEHRKPDVEVVPDPEHREDGYSNGAGPGDVGVGVDVERHDRAAPPDGDK